MKRLMLAVVFMAAACGSSDNPTPDIVDARIDAPTVDAAEPDALDCTGENDCFSCEPTQTSEFLNACTDGTCFPFDNEARLPRYNHGELPPLP